MTAVEETVRQTRYAWGGDQFLFVEIDESMSLQAFQRVSALADAIGAQSIGGVTDVCLTNASLLLRFDPDVVHPAICLARFKRSRTSPGTRPHRSLVLACSSFQFGTTTRLPKKS